jgi:hypothetical protein
MTFEQGTVWAREMPHRVRAGHDEEHVDEPRDGADYEHNDGGDAYLGYDGEEVGGHGCGCGTELAVAAQ